MTPIVDGEWESESNSDDRSYRNYRSVAEFTDQFPLPVFDVVVVGGGGSGTVAAIEAADLGASVVVLEKTEHPGGSTLASGGTIRLVSDLARTAEHFSHLAQGATPRDVIEAFVSGLAEVPDWVSTHGGELVVRAESEPHERNTRVFPISRAGSSFPNYPYADSLAPRALVAPKAPDRSGGPALWHFLSRNLEERDVPVVLGARVARLLQDRDRAVTGVEVEGPGGTVTVGARRGVILCSGGFAYDNELMTQYYGLPLPTVCPPGRATGDGVRLAQDAGADLWHMNALAASVGYWPSELQAGFQCKMPGYGFVMVDQLAQRYVAETSLENHSAVLTMLNQDPHGSLPSDPLLRHLRRGDPTRRDARAPPPRREPPLPLEQGQRCRDRAGLVLEGLVARPARPTARYSGPRPRTHCLGVQRVRCRWP